MKEFFNGCLTVIITFVIFGSIIYGVAYGAFALIGPDYKEGIYTMTYKVYYPGNPKTYTITNNWPIGMTSYRGTNVIEKEVEAPFLKRAFKGVIVFESSAPIEVVSYTYKEK